MGDPAVSAREALARLAAAGVSVQSEGGHLRVRCKNPLSDTQVQYLRTNKAEILASLRAATTASDPTGPCPVCGSPGWWQAKGGGDWHCRGCHPDMPITATTVTVPGGTRANKQVPATSDDRRYCAECTNLAANGACRAAWRGEIQASKDYHPVDDTPRRCEGFAPKSSDPDQRSGRERWPSPPALPEAGTNTLPRSADSVKGGSCGGCSYFRRVDGHLHLGRCAVGRLAPGAGGLWWDTDRHDCDAWRPRPAAPPQGSVAEAKQWVDEHPEAQQIGKARVMVCRRGDLGFHGIMARLRVGGMA
jgi:hypothetical protein